MHTVPAIMISFEHITFAWLFLLIPVLLLLFLLDIRRKEKVKKEIGDPVMVGQLTKNYSPQRARLRVALFLIAFACCIVAIINPRFPEKGNAETMQGIDVMIALDVSNSMLCQDVKPSRLDRAKQLAILLTEKLDNNRVGLVLFAGQAFLQMPLTPDIVQAKMYISNASVDAVPVQGTDFYDALELSAKSMDTKEKKYKAIILISDGEDHEKQISEIAQQLNDQGIITYTIGIGTPTGGPIPDPVTNTMKTDKNGQTIITTLQPQSLEEIAHATNGKFMMLENPDADARTIAQALNNMDKKAITGAGGYKSYFSLYSFFLVPALLLLVIILFIPETKKWPA